MASKAPLAYRLASFDPPRDMRSTAHLPCATCPVIGKLPIVSMGNNPEAINKMFGRLGWDANVWKHAENWCPACVRRREAEAKARLPLDAASRVLTDVPAATTPRGLKDAIRMGSGVRHSSPKEDKVTLKSLSADQKASLRRELDASFDDTTGQYLSGTTDHTISEKLDIPRAIVIEFRELTYGELKEDPELSALRAGFEEMKKFAANFQSSLAKYEERLAAYARKIGM